MYDAGIKLATQDWIFVNTASDIIHPELATKLYKLIENEKFNSEYNNIKYLCAHHVLGISGKNTMFDWGYRNWLGKREAIIAQSQVHDEIHYRDSRTYTLKRNDTVALHHLGQADSE